jgi:hypothetical protein
MRDLLTVLIVFLYSSVFSHRVKENVRALHLPRAPDASERSLPWSVPH